MRAKKRKKKRLYSIGKGLFLFAGLSLVSLFLYTLLFSPDVIRVTEGEENRSYSKGIFQISREDVEDATEAEISKNGGIEVTEEGYVSATATLRLWGIIPVKTVSLEIWEEKHVLVSGQIIGMDLYTDGILVLGIGKVATAEGEVDSPSRGLLYTGDRIRKVCGTTVTSAQEVADILEETNTSQVEIVLERNGKELTLRVPTVKDANGIGRLGVWIRDRARGIGTMTFYDPQSGAWGAVGHGITDVDTEQVLPVGRGTITAAKIRGIVKGEQGTPGEIEASLTSNVLGNVDLNCDVGVYGTGEKEQFSGKAYQIGFQSEVMNGKAYVMTQVVTGTSELYEIQITKTASGANGGRGLLVTVTDKRLLDATGGIVQGMSGSPIIQNGKLIGAVTHVLVNDPTRGYGIYIENMLNAAQTR